VHQARTEAHAAAEAAFQERFAAALALVRVEVNKQARSFSLECTEAPAAARAAAKQHFPAAVRNERTDSSKHTRICFARICFARTSVGCIALACFWMLCVGPPVCHAWSSMEQHGAWSGGGELQSTRACPSNICNALVAELTCVVAPITHSGRGSSQGASRRSRGRSRAAACRSAGA